MAHEQKRQRQRPPQEGEAEVKEEEGKGGAAGEEGASGDDALLWEQVLRFCSAPEATRGLCAEHAIAALGVSKRSGAEPQVLEQVGPILRRGTAFVTRTDLPPSRDKSKKWFVRNLEGKLVPGVVAPAAATVEFMEPQPNDYDLVYLPKGAAAAEQGKVLCYAHSLLPPSRCLTVPPATAAAREWSGLLRDLSGSIETAEVAVRQLTARLRRAEAERQETNAHVQSLANINEARESELGQLQRLAQGKTQEVRRMATALQQASLASQQRVETASDATFRAKRDLVEALQSGKNTDEAVKVKQTELQACRQRVRELSDALRSAATKQPHEALTDLRLAVSLSGGT